MKRKTTEKLVKGPPPAKRYRTLTPAEHRKAWIRDAAAGFVRMDQDGIRIDSKERAAQAFRAVDMARLIWELTNGGDVDAPKNGGA